FMVVAALIYLPTLVYFTGFTGLFLYFIAPWLATHAWFSLTTMMHHISDETPFLTKEHWSFNSSRLLLTTDYMYPKWLLFLTHYISVHTAHHVAPIIPHYNLPEAQAALKTAFPGMVREKPMTVQDVWHVARSCHLYDPVNGFYESFDQPAQAAGDPSTPGARAANGPLTMKQQMLRVHRVVQVAATRHVPHVLHGHGLFPDHAGEGRLQRGLGFGQVVVGNDRRHMVRGVHRNVV
ncbi:fatty acid desaturase, partial [Pseudomonas protegens]|uniref:fatty acid desaturase n=1 Tax=Pseudomonas protegens TaxID=380021 RepID=UPI001FF0AC6A